MNDVYIRNQFELGKDLSKLKYENDSENIYGCLGIYDTDLLSVKNIIQLKKAVYTNEVKLVKRVFKSKVAEIQNLLGEPTLENANRLLIESHNENYEVGSFFKPNIELVKLIAIWLYSNEDRNLKLGKDILNFREWFELYISSEQQLKDLENSAIFEKFLSYIPKSYKTSSNTFIYGTKLISVEDDLDYREILLDALDYLSYPSILSRSFMEEIRSSYNLVGHVDFSMTSKKQFKRIVELEISSGICYAQFVKELGYRFTDFDISLSVDCLLFPYKELLYRCYKRDYIDEADYLLCTESQFNSIYQKDLLQTKTFRGGVWN